MGETWDWNNRCLPYGDFQVLVRASFTRDDNGRDHVAVSEVRSPSSGSGAWIKQTLKVTPLVDPNTLREITYNVGNDRSHRCD